MPTKKKKINKLDLEIVLRLNGENFGGKLNLLDFIKDGILNWEDVKYQGEGLLIGLSKTFEKELKNSSIQYVNPYDKNGN